MLEAIEQRLLTGVPDLFRRVTVVESVTAMWRGPAFETGDLILAPHREEANLNELATGGFRQLCEVEFVTAIIIRQADDPRGSSRARRFDAYKTGLQRLLLGWTHETMDQPMSLIGGVSNEVPSKGISIWVQTWLTAYFLYGDQS
ncbi:hypothetical protein P7L78_09195 [Tistrella bauzanensis]|uniref:phage tail terminator protein n=1 Tax=Tistrella TaxID=171436 RepID=UPI0031F6E8D8